MRLPHLISTPQSSPPAPCLQDFSNITTRYPCPLLPPAFTTDHYPSFITTHPYDRRASPEQNSLIKNKKQHDSLPTALSAFSQCLDQGQLINTMQLSEWEKKINGILPHISLSPNRYRNTQPPVSWTTVGAGTKFSNTPKWLTVRAKNSPKLVRSQSGEFDREVPAPVRVPYSLEEWVTAVSTKLGICIRTR